jgi:hypothetical protein
MSHCIIMYSVQSILEFHIFNFYFSHEKLSPKVGSLKLEEKNAIRDIRYLGHEPKSVWKLHETLC